MTDGAAPRKGNFKFDVESALTVDCTYVGMVSPANLDNLLEREPHISSCQIYAIAHRPRVSVDPANFSCTNGDLSLTYCADWGDGEPAEIVLGVPNVFGKIVTLETANNNTELSFYDDQRTLLVRASAGGWLADLFRGLDGEQRSQNSEVDGNLLDLKVVYVGQSMDAQGATQRRLLNHGTLQKVLADINHATPHLETWVILMSFGAYTNLGMFGTWTTSQGWDKSWEHHTGIVGTTPTERQRVALAEAALIRYFQPRYNKKFVNSFPNVQHASYDSFYTSDYNAVGFELETLTTLSCRLWSDVVRPTFFHSRLFPLHDESARRSFFDFDHGLDLREVLVRPEDRPLRRP